MGWGSGGRRWGWVGSGYRGTWVWAINENPPRPPDFGAKSFSGSRRNDSTATSRNDADASRAAVSTLRAGLRRAFPAPKPQSDSTESEWERFNRNQMIPIPPASMSDPPPKNDIAR